MIQKTFFYGANRRIPPDYTYRHFNTVESIADGVTLECFVTQKQETFSLLFLQKPFVRK
jgi:hypothetical protein